MFSENIVVRQGATFKVDFECFAVTNNPTNLSGWSVRGQMRKSHANSTKTDLTVTHDNTGGKITATLTAAQTTALTAGSYVYDIELYNADTPPEVVRVVEGIITVTPEVTR